MKKGILFILFLFTTASFSQSDLMKQYYYNTSALKNPLQLLGTNLKLWVEADATSIIKDASNNVSVWYDKSMGKALGNNVVVNGTFDDATSWTIGAGWAIANGIATCDGSQEGLSDLYQLGGLIVGKIYTATYTVTRTAGTLRHWSGDFLAQQETASGTYSVTFIAGHSYLSFTGDADFAGTVDNISIQEITGNHLVQSTATSQPLAVAYNRNYSAIRFDGVDDYLKALTFALDSPLTVWVVYKVTSGTVYDGFTAGTINYTDTDTGVYKFTKTVYTTNPAGITLGANATPNSYLNGDVVCLIVKQGLSNFNEDLQINKYVKAKFNVLPAPEVPPDAPSDFIATSNFVRDSLSWSSTTVDSIYIFRNDSSNSATSEKIATLSGNATSYNDSTFTGTYYYWLKGKNSAGESNFSSVASAQILALGDLGRAVGKDVGGITNAQLTTKINQLGLNTIYCFVESQAMWDSLPATFTANPKTAIWIYASILANPPYNRDYKTWASQVATLMNTYPNVQGLIIDDFGWSDPILSVAYTDSVRDIGKAINNNFKLYIGLYTREMANFIYNYKNAVDGVVYFYPYALGTGTVAFTAPIDNIVDSASIEYYQKLIKDTFTGIVVSYPQSTASVKGQYGYASQTVTVTDLDTINMTIKYFDNWMSTLNPAYHIMQLKVDGVTKWQRDISGLDYGTETIDLTEALTGHPTGVIQLGIYDSTSVSSFPIDVFYEIASVKGMTIGNWGVDSSGKYLVQIKSNQQISPLNYTVLPARDEYIYNKFYTDKVYYGNISARINRYGSQLLNNKMDGMVLYGASYTDSDLPNSATYDSVKNVMASLSNGNALPLSRFLPSIVSNLNASGDYNKVNLAYTATGDTIEILRGITASPTTRIAVTTNQSAYADTTTVNGTMYYYRVRVKNTTGYSDYSNQDNDSSITLSADIPTNIAMVGGNLSFTVTWTESGSPDSIAIYGGTSTDPTTLLGTIAGGVSTYTYSSITDEANWYVRVKSKKGTTWSGYSSNATDAVDSTNLVPSASSNFATNGISFYQAVQSVLSWVENEQAMKSVRSTGIVFGFMPSWAVMPTGKYRVTFRAKSSNATYTMFPNGYGTQTIILNPPLTTTYQNYEITKTLTNWNDVIIYADGGDTNKEFIIDDIKVARCVE